MPRLIATLGALATGFGLNAGTDTVVLPEGFEATEDDGWSGVLSTAMRLQEVYGSENLPASPILIDSISFRLDGTQAPVSTTLPSITFSLSTTAKSPGSLSPTFSENLGGDTLVVYSGPLAINSPGGSVPNPFDITVTLSTPFLYDPAAGNLLLDISNPSGTGSLWIVDASNNPGDSASRAFSYDVSGTTAGFVDTGADIIKLGFAVVPEPSPAALLLCGFGVALGMRGHRRPNPRF